jgi:hypothetical protein
LTELTQLSLGKYDECLRSFHALFFLYKLTYFVLSSPRALLCFLFIFETDDNDLTGQIPTELQTLPLNTCYLRECRAFSLPLPLCITLAGIFSFACHRDYPYCR